MSPDAVPARPGTAARRRRSAGRLVVLGGVLVAGMLLAACGEDPAPPAASDGAGEGGAVAGDLTGTTWVLTGWTAGSGGRLRTPADGSEAVLDLLAAGRLAGSGGCNRFFGTWEQSRSRLVLTVGGATDMACAPEVMDQEAAVLETLGRVRSFRRTEGGLELLDSAGATVLRYRAGVQDLEGTAWTATGINNGRGALESSDTTELASLRFGADGTVSGASGCNSFSAPVELTPPDRIRVGEVESTAMGCSPELATQEQQYLAALRAATRYELSGSTLTLRDDQGAMQATFRLAPPPGDGDADVDPDTPVSSG